MSKPTKNTRINLHDAHVQAKISVMTYYYGSNSVPAPAQATACSANAIHALDAQIWNNLPDSVKKGWIH